MPLMLGRLEEAQDEAEALMLFARERGSFLETSYLARAQLGYFVGDAASSLSAARELIEATETGGAFPGRIRDPAHALLVAADEADLDTLQRALAALDAC